MGFRNGAGKSAAQAVETPDVAPAGEPVRRRPTPTDTPKWRDVLPVHPAAELFPLMSRDELLALGEDIKKNGLLQKVVVTQLIGPTGLATYDNDVNADRSSKFSVLDGRNRLDAMEHLGWELFDKNGELKRELSVELDVWSGRLSGGRSYSGDEFDFVIGANIHRRHLTAEQRRELIAKVLKAKPEASNREIAAQVKVDHKTVASVRAEAEATGEIPQLEKTVGRDGKERPSRKPVPSSTPPKVKQKVFDSPQEAHSRPFELGSLPAAWAEVEAFAAAGNTHRLEVALQRLLKEVSAALARVRCLPKDELHGQHKRKGRSPDAGDRPNSIHFPDTSPRRDAATGADAPERQE